MVLKTVLTEVTLPPTTSVQRSVIRSLDMCRFIILAHTTPKLDLGYKSTSWLNFPRSKCYGSRPEIKLGENVINHTEILNPGLILRVGHV